MMPLFMFRCRACGKDFELFLRAAEARQPQQCPYCGAHETEPASAIGEGACPADTPSCGTAKTT
jgi:putative FmdB family regulatory protein